MLSRIKTLLKRSQVIAGVARWFLGHWIAAKSIYGVDDCRDLPKVAGAGTVVNDPDNPNERYQLMHNGLKIKLDSYYGSFITRIIHRLRGHHDPQEERAFHEVLLSLPDDIVMIELGSYWSYFSMWAQLTKKKVRNVLVEPLPENLAAGRNNFSVNGMNGEFLYGYVGAKYKEPHTTVIDNIRLADIECFSIDAIMQMKRLPFVHIVHCDAQGAEFDMLAGAAAAIQNNKIGYFIVSTHSAELHAACLQVFESSRFHCVASYLPAESFSADGLIVARAESYPGLEHIQISKRRAGVVSSIKMIAQYAIDVLRESKKLAT